MRVLCVNSDGWIFYKYTILFKRKEIKCDGPKYGDECEVFNKTTHKGIVYYMLHTWGEDEFDSSQFIPLTGDQLELEKEFENGVREIMKL